MPDEFNLHIPHPRRRQSLADFMNALRAEHRLCRRRPGERLSLGFETYPEGAHERYVLGCTCGGRWTHPRLTNNPNAHKETNP
jgi:hypothetical protein